MTYREPAPRKPRLWYVIFSYSNGKGSSYTHRAWCWALEGHLAIDKEIQKLIQSKEVPGHDHISSWRTAVCGEDFAEREIKGEEATK